MLVHIVFSHGPDEWRVTAEDPAGSRLAVFTGPDAKQRACDYAAWMNHAMGPQGRAGNLTLVS